MLKKIIVLLLFAFSLSGCLSPIKTPEESSYTLTSYTTHHATHTKKTHTQKILLITTPTASPGYGSSDMIYVMIPYQLKSFADHRWVAPPSELLLPLLTEKMHRTGLFKAVVTPPFTGAATYQLSTQLLMLQQEFLQPQSEVRLVMSATLIKIASGRVVGNRIFSVLVPAEGNNPYGGVLATNKAAHRIINQIAQFVVQRARN